MSITIIEKSNLHPHIAKTVQTIVQDWNAHIEQAVGSAEFGLTYKAAYEDVCNTLVEARAKAYEKYPLEGEYGDEYRLGFTIGYIESTLDTHWKGKYYLPQQKVYRNISWLKAIYSYLQFDRSALLAVSRLYHHIMADDTGQYSSFDNLLHDISNDLTVEHTPLPIDEETLTQNLQALEALIFTYILEAINTHITDEPEDDWLKPFSFYLPQLVIGEFVNSYRP